MAKFNILEILETGARSSAVPQAAERLHSIVAQFSEDTRASINSSTDLELLADRLRNQIELALRSDAAAEQAEALSASLENFDAEFATILEVAKIDEDLASQSQIHKSDGTLKKFC